MLDLMRKKIVFDLEFHDCCDHHSVVCVCVCVFCPQSSVMMNCQAPRKPYRVSQMTTVFITLLCFPSFLGASVCVTYTMWRHVNTVHTR